MAMDEGADFQSVFLDLSKAYDRVSISGLLSKLSLIGFTTLPLSGLLTVLSTAQTAMCKLAEHSIYLPDPTVRNTPGHSSRTSAFPDLYQWPLWVDSESSFILCWRHDPSRYWQSLVSSCVILSGDLDRAANWADRWGMLFSAPKSKHLPIGRAGTAESICVHERGSGLLSRRFGHTSTLGLFLTAHLHGMTIFRTFTLYVLGWQEFCDALMEAFHHCLWKTFIQLSFALA